MLHCSSAWLCPGSESEPGASEPESWTVMAPGVLPMPSIIVLKLIRNSIKGTKKNHLKFIFSVESMLPILLIHCSVLHYECIATIGLPYVQT